MARLSGDQNRPIKPRNFTARAGRSRRLARHVDLSATPPVIEVWRSVRTSGDTKTKKSRRTLAIPDVAVEALRRRKREQEADRAKAGANWLRSTSGDTVGEQFASHRVPHRDLIHARARGHDQTCRRDPVGRCDVTRGSVLLSIWRSSCSSRSASPAARPGCGFRRGQLPGMCGRTPRPEALAGW